MKRKQAVVIGAGIAGLLASRVLSDFFENVILLEQDSDLDDQNQRQGVPQRLHIHVLLKRGETIMLKMFPSLDGILKEGGVPELDLAADHYWMHPNGLVPRFKSGIISKFLSRPFLEDSIRKLALQIPNIRLQTHTKAEGIELSEDQAVTGVMVRSKKKTKTPQRGLIEADLVVDASGRNSALQKWLERYHYPAPPTTVVESGTGYSTRIYSLEETTIGLKAVLIAGGGRTGLIAPIEGDRYMVTLVGWKPDFPPKEETEFLKFAQSLRHNLIYDLINGGEPLGPIQIYRKMENVCRFYGELPKWPKGLISFGDSLCYLNPVHGQGMSLSSIYAELLQEMIPFSDKIPNWEQSFHRRAVECAKDPWFLSTGQALSFRSGATLKNKYRFWLFQKIARTLPLDKKAYLAFLHVKNLLKPMEEFTNLKFLMRSYYFELRKNLENKFPKVKDGLS